MLQSVQWYTVSILSSKNLQKNALYVGLVFTVLVISYQYFHTVQTKYLAITSFKECVDAGFQVITTYPEKCISYGKSFVNPLQKKNDQKSLRVPFVENTDYKNQAYIIEGEQIRFTDGRGILPPNFVLKQATTSLRIADTPFLHDINNDGIQDTIFLIRTEDQIAKKSTYYLYSSVSLREGFYGSNALFRDFALIDAAFMYKNGEIVIGYTIEGASTTLKQKYFTFEDDILKQLSHK